jgi:hypothetical protein
MIFCYPRYLRSSAVWYARSRNIFDWLVEPTTYLHNSRIGPDKYEDKHENNKDEDQDEDEANDDHNNEGQRRKQETQW